MSKQKKIKKVEGSELTDADELTYFLSYDEDMCQIMLTICAPKPMTPEDYVNTLASFVNDMSEFPDTLFVESMDDLTDMRH